MPTKAFRHPLFLFQQLEKKLVRGEEICIFQDTEQKFCSQGSPKEVILQKDLCLTEVSLNGRGELHWRLIHLFPKLQEKTGTKRQGK